jgi:hypothetical protein
MQKEYFTWEQVDKLTKDICKSIQSRDKKYDWIIGINRGGLIPSVILSHKLGIPHGVLTVTHYEGEKMLADVSKDLYISGIKAIKKHHNILLVDDIADSGICLMESVKTIMKLDSDAQNIDTATLFYKSKSIVKPKFYGIEISSDIWVSFPWEQAEIKNAVRV